jgi:hypothetical protein
MNMSESDSEMDQVAAYRHLNSLVYARPSSGSLISQRTQKLSYPASLTYTMGSTMQFVINSGAESVWGPSSYLKLAVTHTNSVSGAVTITGSMFNLFSQARLYHRSGELLEQVFFADVLSNIKLRYATSFSDYQKLKYLIGATNVPGATSAPLGFDSTAAATQYTDSFNLPLSLLFGVFNNHSQYIPSQLLAGARLELVLNSSSAASGFTYSTINAVSPTLSLDCATLYDAASKQILEESSDVSESGIQFTYSTYFASQFTPTGSALNIDVLQSASITEKVFVVGAPANETATKYNFKSLGAAYSLQARIGSHYLPIYAIQNDNESFYQSQIAFNGAYNQYSSAPAQTGVSVEYMTVVAPAADNAVYAFSLEKSGAGVALSGEPTNNSRICNIACSGASNVNGTDFKYATVFLQYVRVANCMVDSCVVDR